jgi:hypothetical protein
LLNPNFRDILALLSAEEAEFLVVGAYALGVHGLVRGTNDLDIWVRPTLENAEKVWRALARFPAPLSSLTKKDLATHDIVFRMGLPPSQVDIITSVSGLQFEDAWPHRIVHEVHGVRVNVIGVEDQIKNKRSTGRPKDVLDADWLERHKTR